MILGAFESFQCSLAFGKAFFQLFLLLIFSFFTHIYAYYIICGYTEQITFNLHVQFKVWSLSALK